MSANARETNGSQERHASRSNPKQSIWYSPKYRNFKFHQIKHKPGRSAPATMDGRLLKNAVECYAKIKEITYREAYERLSS